jgi:hypothetical protein
MTASHAAAAWCDEARGLYGEIHKIEEAARHAAFAQDGVRLEELRRQRRDALRRLEAAKARALLAEWRAVTTYVLPRNRG